MIIEITGKRGAGKTTLATKLAYEIKSRGFSILLISFADPIKRVLRKCGVVKNHPPTAIYKNFNEWYENLIKHTLNEVPKKYQEDITEYLHNNNYVNSIQAAYQIYFEEADFEKGSRLLMQLYGSLLRSYKNDIFVEILLKNIENCNSDFVIIDDYRFPNEAIDGAFKICVKSSNDEMLKDNEIDNHESEIYVSYLPCDLVVKREQDKYSPPLSSIIQEVCYV
jgi:hypothetical protein